MARRADRFVVWNAVLPLFALVSCGGHGLGPRDGSAGDRPGQAGVSGGADASAGAAAGGVTGLAGGAGSSGVGSDGGVAGTPTGAAGTAAGAAGTAAGAAGSAGGDAGMGGARLTSKVTSYTFETVVVGRKALERPVFVTNSGDATSGVLKVALGGASAADFTLTFDGCTGTRLDAAAVCEVRLNAIPVTVGDLTAWLTIEGAPGGTVKVPLSGTSVAPAVLTITPSSYDFGLAAYQTFGNSNTPAVTFTVKNTGGPTLGPPVVGVGGTNPKFFVIKENTCGANPLPTGGECTVGLWFYPFGLMFPVNGPKEGTLEVWSGDDRTIVPLKGMVSTKLTVSFGGTGAGRLVSTPAGIDCPGACSAAFTVRTVLITITPDANSVVSQWTQCGLVRPSCEVEMYTGDNSLNVILDPK